MAYTYDELHRMTVAQLRGIAKGVDHDAVHGYTTMHKHELLSALCEALQIKAHAHHEIIGIDKTKIKAQIRELKLKRDAAIEAHDSKALKVIRKRIKRLKHQIRRATV